MSVDGLAVRFPWLDPTIASLLDAARAAGAPRLVELDPPAARDRVRAGDGLVAPGPDMAEVVDLEVPTTSRVPLRRYVPDRVRTDTVLVWFHGGGWMTGDIGYSDAFCRLLADGIGCVVHSVGYRLAPEHRFPAAVDDALAAVRWSAGPSAVVVGGDSAGGNLAAVCAQQLRDGLVAGQLLVYPVLDDDVTRESYVRNAGLVLGPAEMTWFFDHYAPSAGDRQSDCFAPVKAASLRSIAPAVIAVAGHDPLHDEGIAYADALREAGVTVTLLDFEPLVHGFLRFTGPAQAAAVAAHEIVVAAAALFGVDVVTEPRREPIG